MADKFTYGELTTRGIYKLNDIYHEQGLFHKNFLDLGSGYGRIVRLLAEYNAEMKCTGIELDEEKHIVSEKINRWSPASKRMNYINGDIFDNMHLLEEADYIFGNTLVWELEDTTKLVKKISSLPNKTFIFNSRQKYNYEVVMLNVSWIKQPQPFYKLNTITNR
tara:strand:+ start:421 stop:912 length:492 start_codon:yes stop_codon:yes gene_type:complete